MKQLSFKSNVRNAFIHPEKYFNFKLDQFISLLKQGQRCTNVEKWKIKSILSPKVHLARFYGIFKEVAYFCMRPIDKYLSALDGFLSSKGFLTWVLNPSNVWLLPTFYVWGRKMTWSEVSLRKQCNDRAWSLTKYRKSCASNLNHRTI